MWSGSAAFPFPRDDLGSLCIPGPSGHSLAMDAAGWKLVSAAGKQQPAKQEDKGNWEGVKEHLQDTVLSICHSERNMG